MREDVLHQIQEWLDQQGEQLDAMAAEFRQESFDIRPATLAEISRYFVAIGETEGRKVPPDSVLYLMTERANPGGKSRIIIQSADWTFYVLTEAEAHGYWLQHDRPN